MASTTSDNAQRQTPHPIQDRVLHLIRAQNLFQPGDHILASVSGGPDSVALLAFLVEIRQRWNLRVHVLHVNHELRGAESEEDARFVEHMCQQFRVPLSIERSPLFGRDGTKKTSSLQARAREARYAALRCFKERIGATRIALGHTADDQAETILMRMIRGAGLRGLAGIPAVRENDIIRPFLKVRKAELLEYLRDRSLSYRMDSSNTQLHYLRNRIRHQLLPMLWECNPEIVSGLNRQADILRSEDDLLEAMVSEQLTALSVEQNKGEVALRRSALIALPLPLQRRLIRRVVRGMFGGEGEPSFKVVSAICDSVLHGRSGASFISRHYLVRREYDTIRWIPYRKEGKIRAEQKNKIRKGGSGFERGVGEREMLLHVPGSVAWPPTGQHIHAHLVSLSEGTGSECLEQTAPFQVTFDADTLPGELVVRTWKPGDIFYPCGMKGKRKKLQDFFSDQKVPKAVRHRIPLVVGSLGIAWVAGMRKDERFVPTRSTQRLLVVAIESRSLTLEKR